MNKFIATWTPPIKATLPGVPRTLTVKAKGTCLDPGAVDSGPAIQNNTNVKLRGFVATMSAVTPVDKTTTCSTLFVPTGPNSKASFYPGGEATIKWKTQGGRINPSSAVFDLYAFGVAGFPNSPGSLSFGATAAGSHVVAGSFLGVDFAVDAFLSTSETEFLAQCNSRRGLKRITSLQPLGNGNPLEVIPNIYG